MPSAAFLIGTNKTLNQGLETKQACPDLTGMNAIINEERSTSMNAIYLALLGGINIGGKTKVKMANLKACFEKLGYGHVQTYGNSGNVIFTAASTNPRKLESHLEEALATNFSSSIGVFIHSLDDMREVMEEIPKDRQTSSERKCDIIFLRQTIDHPKSSMIFSLNPALKNFSIGQEYCSGQ